MFRHFWLSKHHVFSFSEVRRNLRNAANRGRSLPKFIKGKVTTLDDNIADQLGPVESYDEMNRILKKMFTDPEEIQSDIELEMESDNLSSMLTVKGKAEEMTIENLMQDKKRIKMKITEHRYFKPPQETNLLTWAAKKQIRYLHQLDPKVWSPKRLSECFPISETGAKRLLKHKSRVEDPEKIAAHDAEVAKLWKTLQSGGDTSSISPVTLKLWREGKLVKDFYSGNVSIPQPPEPEIIETRTKNKKVGEHLSIVKKYIDLKKNSEEKKMIANEKTVPQMLSSGNHIPKREITSVQKSVLPNLQQVPVGKLEAEDQLATSYLATSKLDKNEPDMQCDQFKQNLNQEYELKKDKSEADSAYLEWLQTENSQTCQPDIEVKEIDISTIATSSDLKKFSKENSLELKTDDGVAYLYDSKLGYQYPVGKEITPSHIKIHQHLYKKGAIYKLGRCYYDDTGEFLYRLPFEIKV